MTVAALGMVAPKTQDGQTPPAGKYAPGPDSFKAGLLLSRFLIRTTLFA